MAQKIVTVTLNPDTLELTVNNEGFQGKGCSAIVEAFAKTGKVTKDIQKPEYKLVNQNQVCK